MNWYKMLFVSTWPPNMHLKLTKHERFCKQNNQLPTKSHDELKDNSNVKIFFLIKESQIASHYVLQFYLAWPIYVYDKVFYHYLIHPIMNENI